ALPFAVPLPFLQLVVPTGQNVQDAGITECDLIAHISGNKLPVYVWTRAFEFGNEAVLNERLVAADLILNDVDPVARARLELLDSIVDLFNFRLVLSGKGFFVACRVRREIWQVPGVEKPQRQFDFFDGAFDESERLALREWHYFSERTGGIYRHRVIAFAD